MRSGFEPRHLPRHYHAMSHTTPPTDDRDAWSAYWDEDGAAGGQAVRGDRKAEALAGLWREQLAAHIPSGGRLKSLDIACGAGVVSALIADLGREAGAEIALHGTDYAQSALDGAAAALAPLPFDTRAADARDLPYTDHLFDLVVSQYGLEYAGESAFSEAARVTAPDGVFLAFVHRTDGAIYRECAGNLAILDAVINSRILPRFERLLTVSERLDAGKAAPKAVQKKTADHERLVAELTRTVTAGRAGSARAHAQRLLGDMAQLFSRRRAYAANDVKSWIAGQSADLAGFRERMRSMMRASIDGDGMERVRERLIAAGLAEVEIGPLILRAGDPPAGWTVLARNP